MVQSISAHVVMRSATNSARQRHPRAIVLQAMHYAHPATQQATYYIKALSTNKLQEAESLLRQVIQLIKKFQPNVAVKWLTLRLCIWEALGSNIGTEDSYTDWSFSLFSSVHPGKCRKSSLN
jgi:hypothetical protein